MQDVVSLARAKIAHWILEIPDIEVPECPGPLDVLKEDGGRRHGRILYAQSAFGIAAFLIKHPHEKSDWLEVQIAGIESVLKAYRSLLAAESASAGLCSRPRRADRAQAAA